MSTYRLARLILALMFLSSSFKPAWSFASDRRPPWCERSAWIEGTELRVTGVASHAKDRETGRQVAYENGLKEIRNFFASIGGTIPPVITQMTFEDANPDGSFDVYRLLKVELSEVDSKPFDNRFTSRLGHQDGGSGTLRILSVPHGAEVYLNSDHVGRTNAELSNVGEGAYQVLLKLPNYQPRHTTVVVSPSRATSIRETLLPKQGSLQVDGTPGAKAKIAGIGETIVPGRLDGLAVGKRYTLHVEKGGALSQERTVEVTDDFERTVRVDLDPLPGELTILSDPDGADVVIDGAAVGTTPVRSLKLAPGKRTVVIKRADFVDQTIAIDLRPKEKHLLPIVKLEPISEAKRQAAAWLSNWYQRAWLWDLSLGFRTATTSDAGESATFGIHLERRLGSGAGLEAEARAEQRFASLMFGVPIAIGQSEGTRIYLAPRGRRLVPTGDSVMYGVTGLGLGLGASHADAGTGLSLRLDLEGTRYGDTPAASRAYSFGLSLGIGGTF